MTRAQYDSPWKSILERYFQQLVIFFLPEVSQEIDWSKHYQFLDKELLAIQKKSKVGHKIADKLVKVFSLTGEEAWVIIHIEVQGSKESHFSERMFEYYYRIFDKYKRPLMCLAILTDNHANWRPQTYQRAQWGCSLTLNFPIIKLIDYESQKTALEISPNPIAKVVAAHLAALRTKGNVQLRYQHKVALVKNLYPLGYTGDDIRILYSFIDYVLALPDTLEKDFIVSIQEFEREVDMQYVTSAERLGIEKGIEKGREEGARKLCRFLLENKFGTISAKHLQKLETLTKTEIEQLCKTLLSANNINDLFE